ncbi:reverse transcriptase domain, reverse transcriptase zinc-binding domain protein [Tanacetum coccineum]
MHNMEAVEGATVVIPMEAVEEVSSRFQNTLYGFFIGKRLAFPLVENYVKNTWAKFGLKRVMLDDDFFLFQFETKEGMEKVMEGGPWLISSVGSSYIDIAMREFKECVDEIEVVDVQNSGLQFTWNQKPRGGDGSFYNHGKSNHQNVDLLRVELDRVQADLDRDPSNASLRDEEAAYVIAYNNALLLQERFLKQRAKVQWLKEVLFENDQVPIAFTTHYEVFLGQPGVTQPLDTLGLFPTKLNDNDALYMVRNVSEVEVKEDYVSLCHVLVKCIARIIANRIKESLKVLISPNQSAFVPGIMGVVKAKVAWEVVCLPKEEGGLGIKRLADFNKALMTSHIWKLLSKKDSLWVKWIHTYKLRDRNYWEIPCRGNMTWGWRNILRLRPIIREFFWYKIGDGSDVSVWFDRWCNASPLDAIVSSRDMYRAGLSRYSKFRSCLKLGWTTAGFRQSMDSYSYANIPFARKDRPRSVIAKLVCGLLLRILYGKSEYQSFHKD